MQVLNDNIISLLKGDKGEKGDGLEIKKWYASTEEMAADYSNPEIAVGDCVAINNTLDLYVKGASAFESTGTLKGAKGDKGDTGASGVNDVTAGTTSEEEEYTVTPITFNFETGNSKTVNVKARNGAKGDPGASGVTDVTTGTPTNDGEYTATPLTFNFEEGNSKTISVKAKDGEKGDKGDKGDDGVSITGAILIPVTREQ